MHLYVLNVYVLLLFVTGGPYPVGDPQHFHMQCTFVQYMRVLQMCLGSSAQVRKNAIRLQHECWPGYHSRRKASALVETEPKLKWVMSGLLARK